MSLGNGGVFLLVLTLVCWFLLIVYLFGVAGQQAHGDAVVGQALSFFAAAILAGLTWLWVGGLLLKAGSEDRMPAWAAVPAVVLYLAAGAAGAVCFYLIQDPGRVWPAFIPALLPPVLALYVIALYVPSMRPFALGTGSYAVWSFVLILTVAPQPSFVQKLNATRAGKIARAEGMEEWKIREQARHREENLAKLQAMTADEPLTSWFPLLDEKSGVSAEAFEAVRKVPRRQSDIEDMLPYGLVRAMTLLPNLDLQATPQLCEAAKAFMLKNAKETRVRPKQDPRPYDPAFGVEEFLPGIRWLLAHGCDCDEGIAALKASVGTHIESADRNNAMATLEALLKK